MADIPPISEFQQDAAIKDRFDEIKQRPVVLSVDGVGKTFSTSAGGSVRALESIDFQVHRREFICVIGASGCGKSTLIRILAGLETATDGTVNIDGKPVSGPGPDRGMVFQGYTLFPWLSVLGNVMFGPTMRDLPRATAESEARQWIDMVGLERFADHYPNQLSGGMKQRVAIARALANQPRILLMDEPFGALDAQTRAKMQRHLLDIWHKVNVTVLFITHDLDEAVYLADRILVLGAHPGHVQEIIEVPVPRPRSPDQFLEPAFLATKRHIHELIHPKEDEQDEEDTTHLPKMTTVGDEAE